MGNCVGTRREALHLTKKREWEHVMPRLHLTKKREWEHVMPRRGCQHCKRSEEDWTCPLLGSCSCPRNTQLPLSSCVFYSPRIHDLIEGERTELETSQAHWTEVHDKNDAEMVRVGEENRKYFDGVLMKDARWGGFFSKFEGLSVNEKIGEGGQAEIFKASMTYGVYKDYALVAKVFKGNIPLRDLKEQWPQKELLEDRNEIHPDSEFMEIINPFTSVHGGAFIREGIHKNRFAFVMKRRVCDLRAFIDKRMLKLVGTHSHGPPFGDIIDVCELLRSVATNMARLHERGVVHRDIKASNVLLDIPIGEGFGRGRGGLGGSYGRGLGGLGGSYLMDFECALGAMGTGFWRAPEILEQVERRVPSQEVVFTKESDIYSFGMLCYEVVTGCIPFDGHPQNDYSVVINGGRPELPCNLDPILRGLIVDCWEGNPKHRPRALQVQKTILDHCRTY